MRVAEARAVFAESADFFQRASDATGISGELNGRSIGEKFALAADGGLDEPSKKNTDVTDDSAAQAPIWAMDFVRDCARRHARFATARDR